MDFAHPKGSRMSKEQTELALQRLAASSPTPEGKATRELYISQLKESGILDDPNVERLYAVGSSTTTKPNPTDLDILYRGKTAQQTDDVFTALENRVFDKDLDTHSLHLLAPNTIETFGASTQTRFKPQPAFTRTAESTAKEIASIGTERYGMNHKWVRLVAIPAAVGLGLLTEGEANEAEAAFKPYEMARAAINLIRHNKIDILEGNKTEMKRIVDVLEGMNVVPAKEYRRVEAVDVLPPHHTRHQLARGYYSPGRNPFIVLNARYANKTTPIHEFTHARQHTVPGVIRATDELAKHVNKWIQDPYQKYIKHPREVHARYVQEIASAYKTEIPQSIYDRIYNHELLRAVQYTERWLKDLDPTFKPRFIKSLAIGSAVLTSLSMLPDTAEAMPRGVYQPITKTTGKLSSAAKTLAGKTIDEGKTIKTILKGEGDTRYIHFTDGTESVVTKQDVNKLARSIGTDEYIKKFRSQPTEDLQLAQALRSLNYHERLAIHTKPGNLGEELVYHYVDQYLEHLSEMGKTLPPDICFVKKGDKLFTLPRPYAELLEEQGILKIVRSKKYIELLNKHRIK